MIGHGRDVELDAFPGIALALAVEWLMDAVLLEQDHRQQAGADPAARDDVEGCRWLGDRLAVPAGELLAHGLPHEPAPRDDVEGLGDDLADLGEPAAAAAAAGGGRRDDDPLARQMLRQRPARRACCRTWAPTTVPRCRRSFGRRLVLGHGLLELGQLELELVDEPLPRSLVWPNCSRRALASSSFRRSISSLAADTMASARWLGLVRASRSARIIACAAARSAAAERGRFCML